MAPYKQTRLLTPNCRPVLALRAMALLSTNQPSGRSLVTTHALARHIGKAIETAAMLKAALGRLLDHGMVKHVPPEQWQLLQPGLDMLLRIDEAAADKLSPRARRQADAIDADQAAKANPPAPPYVGQIVPPPHINRLAGNYDKDECNFKHVREGALDFRDLPSRRGNVLHYRDGRTELINHGNQPPQRPRPAQAELQQITPPGAAATPAANDHAVTKRKQRA